MAALGRWEPGTVVVVVAGGRDAYRLGPITYADAKDYRVGISRP